MHLVGSKLLVIFCVHLDTTVSTDESSFFWLNRVDLGNDVAKPLDRSTDLTRVPLRVNAFVKDASNKQATASSIRNLMTNIAQGFPRV
jgi:hypothetical protein